MLLRRDFFYEPKAHHEKLHSGSDVHKPKWGLVLLLVSAVKD